jgi:hypothetical protein
MASLTLRQSKGSPLTFAEVDGNFTALNNELAEKALAARTIAAGTGLAGGGDLSANRTISLNAGSIASLGLADTAVQPAGLTPYAPLASPTFTGVPAAPTAAASANTTQLATTAYVKSQLVTSDTDVTAGRAIVTPAGPAQAFRRGNILGTVSQSGGVPTGAVIERGSNANGTYLKYADGTMIQYTVSRALGNMSASGNIFKTAVSEFTLPAAYGSASDYIAMGANADFAGNHWVSARNKSGSEVELAGWSSELRNDRTGYAITIGRWF